jgi:hypothetical protein
MTNPNPGDPRRGDLAIIRRIVRPGALYGRDSSWEVAVVTSVHRDGRVKAVRGLHEAAQVEQVARMGRHSIFTLLASEIDVPAALSAIRAGRARDSGRVSYDSSAELMRDLQVHARSDGALAAVESVPRWNTVNRLLTHRIEM